MELLKKMNEYVRAFNEADEECYIQKIDNAHAAGWMADNVPLMECPDEDFERTWYFRWWTYRKALRDTPEGTVITEFLAPVRWAGAYNTINAAAGFHLREGRWLRGSRDVTENYLRFWLTGSGDGRKYSSWLIWAAWELCTVTRRFAALEPDYAAMEADCRWWEENHFNEEIGLYWSHDARDAMEFSISGSGFRPTLNSYMVANFRALALFAEKFAELMPEKAEYYGEKAAYYEDKALRLWETVENTLLDTDGFFKVLPADVDKKEGFRGLLYRSLAEVPEELRVRELIDFVPWQFDCPAADTTCFRTLTDPAVFLGAAGLRTADASHPRYRFASEHECLWNGPSWPFATAQTLTACANILNSGNDEAFTNDDFFLLLRQYVLQHRRTLPDGRVTAWIDEDLDPEDGRWLARELLEKAGWQEKKGGYERGKDYNHSMFCDLIITGLLGLDVLEDGSVSLQPRLPMEWDYFRMERLCVGDTLYTVTFDKTGERYGEGVGWHVSQEKTAQTV